LEVYHRIPRLSSSHAIPSTEEFDRMVVEIHRTGDWDWPRYFLAARSREGDLFWNGERWVSDCREVCLFAFLPEVCREFERLQVQRHCQQFVQEFEAKVTVRLHSDQAMSERELARFLDRFAELFLPTDGPTDDSLIQAEIHWRELRKRMRNPSRDEESPD
jgi:hypothetical protein